MALRTIRQFGDEILRKKSKPIDKIDDKILELIEDMFDTMYDAQGVGLAAVQVGILKRIFVIDVGDGPMVFINPEIISTEGSQIDEEGCLSGQGYEKELERPLKAVVEALNEKGEKVRIEGEGLLARAICHESDHLDGILFIDYIEESQ